MCVYMYIYIHESAHLLCVNGTPICGTRTVFSTDMAPYIYIYIYIYREREKARTCCVNGTPICGTRTVLSIGMAPATGATHANSGEATATCAVAHSRAAEGEAQLAGARRGASRLWPLHDIVSLRSFCARINHPVMPPTSIPPTIAILLHVYCAIYDAPSTPPWCAIHHTILVMAISCKGQSRPGTTHRSAGRWPLHDSHCQYGMVYGIYKGGRVVVVYCALVVQ